MTLIRNLAGFVALSMVLVTCGSAVQERDKVGELSDEAAAYLDSVREIQGRVDDAFDDVDDALSRSYPTREVLLSSVQAVGYAGLAGTTFSLAQELTPPPEFETDHGSWLAHRRLATQESSLLTEAIEAGDLQAMFAVFTRLDQDFGDLLAPVDRDFCLAVTNGQDVICPAGEDLPGGNYGAEVYEALRLTVLSNLGFFDFFGDMSPDERALRLEEVQPYIEANLADGGNSLEAIAAPNKYKADHQVLIAFYEDQYATAVEITMANAERDNERVLELFAKSGVTADTAASALSAEYREIAAPLFDPEDSR